MKDKSDFSRRSFFSTSVKSLAGVSMGLSLSNNTFAQRPDANTGEILIRKSIEITETPDLEKFYTDLQRTGVNREYHEFTITRSGSEISLRVDPATIKTIIEAGILLYSLFGGGDEKVTEWITKVSDQLTKIAKILEDVQNVLEDLKILIKHEFIQNAEYELLAQADVYLRNASKLAARPNLPSSQNLMNQILLEIQGRVSKCRLYGYATYNTVGYAMRIETDLIYLLKESKKTKQETFKYYNQYFSECLNPVMPGSVTNIRVATEQGMRDLEAQYPPRNNVRENFGWVHWRGHKSDHRAFAFKITNGSLINGFTGNVATEQHSVQNDDTCGVRCEVGNIENARSSRGEGEALQPFRDQLNGQLNIMNRASVLYKELLTRFETLKVAEEQVSKLKLVAKELHDKAA